jgi:arylsulfatase A-like enzyme
VRRVQLLDRLALGGGKGTLKEGGVRLPAIVNERLHHVDIMPTLLAIAGGKGSPDTLFDGKDSWATLSENKASPHKDILIDVDAFRGAIRKGRWRLTKVAVLPGKTELFDLSNDPGEKENVADRHRDVVQDLGARLMNYVRQQKASE